MPATVTQQAGTVRIENVPAFNYTMGRDSLVLAAQSAAAALGQQVSYATLKGLSATAFRLIFHPGWQRCTPDALCGFDHTALLFRPLGLCAALLPRLQKEEACQVITASIRAGYPVLALHLMDWEDWGVVAGFRPQGYQLLCRTPHDPGPELVTHQRFPERLLRLTGETMPLPRLAALRESLETAVYLFETERFGIERFGAYFSGRAAYMAWIDGLRERAFYQPFEQHAQANSDYFAQVWQEEAPNLQDDTRYASPYFERAHVNAWRLASLTDARAAAATYLNEAARATEGDCAQALGAAADFYLKIENWLAQARLLAPWEGDLPRTAWTQSMRAAQAEFLEQALALETQAVACLKEALACW